MLTLPAKPVLAFTAASVGFSIISKIFGFYYVKVFLDHYHITNWWFQWSQVLFMVWNTLNDPLFAYIQDQAKLPFVKTRRQAVLYSGPLFALVFLIPWFPWGDANSPPWIIGLHLITSLCLYDTMYTFVGLAQSCLFAEISRCHDDRVQLLRWSKLGALSATLALYFCEFSSVSLEHFGNFQFCAVSLTLVSCALYVYAGKHAVTRYDGVSENIRPEEQSEDSIWRLTWQIVTSKNFLAFVAVNFCHIFHSVFLGSFMVIIAENLAPAEVVPPEARRILYGLKDMLPAVLIIFGASHISRIGYYKLIKMNFLVKIGLALVLLTCGMGHPWLLMMTMVIDGGVSSASFSMFGMPLTDIVEEDKLRYRRKLPVTSMVFGTNAVIVKCVYSLSPMIVVGILNNYKYNEFKENPQLLTASETDTLKTVLFTLVCFIPVITGTLQLLAWSKYNLKHTHKHKSEEV